MEIFRAPRVFLIARPEFLEPEHLRVEWRGDATAGERLAEFAGRICYMSQHNPASRTTAEYLENIKKQGRSEEHTSELQSPCNLVCRLLLEKKKKIQNTTISQNTKYKTKTTHKQRSHVTYK